MMHGLTIHKVWKVISLAVKAKQMEGILEEGGKDNTEILSVWRGWRICSCRGPDWPQPQRGALQIVISNEFCY